MHFASLKDCTDQSRIADNLSINPIIRLNGNHITYDNTTVAEFEIMFVPNIRDANTFSSEALTKILPRIKWQGEDDTTNLRVAARIFKIALRRLFRQAKKLE